MSRHVIGLQIQLDEVLSSLPLEAAQAVLFVIALICYAIIICWRCRRWWCYKLAERDENKFMWLIVVTLSRALPCTQQSLYAGNNSEPRTHDESAKQKLFHNPISISLKNNEWIREAASLSGGFNKSTRKRQTLSFHQRDTHKHEGKGKLKIFLRKAASLMVRRARKWTAKIVIFLIEFFLSCSCFRLGEIKTEFYIIRERGGLAFRRRQDNGLQFRLDSRTFLSPAGKFTSLFQF